MRATPENLSKLAGNTKSETKKYFARLKKKNPKQLDGLMQELHNEEFSRTNCLDCANCCKTTSPIFIDKDINRIARFLRMKEQQFIETYLFRDEDDFMVLQQEPCPFLDLNDNTCGIYEVRPKACSEYPHTNRKRFSQLLNLTLKNTEVCPAVYNIVEELKTKLTY